MKVRNVINESSGIKVSHQFIITTATARILQSYDSIIVKQTKKHTYLDRDKWDYSTTTGKYRNQFLGEDITETRKKIKSGEYKLVNLNK